MVHPQGIQKKTLPDSFYFQGKKKSFHQELSPSRPADPRKNSSYDYRSVRPDFGGRSRSQDRTSLLGFDII